MPYVSGILSHVREFVYDAALNVGIYAVQMCFAALYERISVSCTGSYHATLNNDISIAYM
jgi:hypothetical protein